MEENVQLAVPHEGQGLVVPGPVNSAVEPAVNAHPGLPPLLPRVRRVCVEPVLEGVDRRDPGDDADDPLQPLAVGPPSCSSVRTSLSSPTAFMKMKGQRRSVSSL